MLLTAIVREVRRPACWSAIRRTGRTFSSAPRMRPGIVRATASSFFSTA